MDRANTESLVRLERIEKIPNYGAAFDHLTQFYKRSARTTPTSRESGEIDMTADSDDGAASRSESGLDGVEGNDQAGKVDAVDLAAGVTCMSCLRNDTIPFAHMSSG